MIGAKIDQANFNFIKGMLKFKMKLIHSIGLFPFLNQFDFVIYIQFETFSKQEYTKI